MAPNVRFNEARADHAVEFITRRLRHTKGRWAGRRFQLDQWQEQDIIRPLFGTERWSPELGRWVRAFRKAYIELPKKEGKSELGAAIGAQGLYADGEGGPEIFSIAADKKQAGLVFNVGADMVQLDKALNARSKVFRSKIAHHGVIEVPKTRGVWKVLPGDVDTVDGINPSRVILDELHRQPGRHLYDLIDESFGARDEPLFVILTTAGWQDPEHISWEVHEYARQVNAGTLEDPFLFTYMKWLEPEAVDGEGWRDEKLWRSVNPSLAGFNPAKIDELRRLAAEAQESPAKVAAFCRYRLNVWLPKSAVNANRLIDLRAWDRTAGLTQYTPDQTSTAWVGVDLAASDDLAAAVLLKVNPPGECRNRCTETCYDAHARFWIPETNLTDAGKPWARALKDRIRQWVRDGWVKVTEGDIIDDRDIQHQLETWARDWYIAGIAKDPWQSKQLGVLLMDQGLPVVDWGQTMSKMSPGTHELIHLVNSGRLHHGGNPVLRWMLDNTITRSDHDGHIRPSKRASSGKIDGIVALVMAIGIGHAEDTTGGVNISFA